MDVVEPLVWPAVAEVLAGLQLILDYYLTRQDEDAVTPHELKRVRQELGQIENQKRRLLNTYQTEIIELDELETRRQVLDQQCQALEQRTYLREYRVRATIITHIDQCSRWYRRSRSEW